MIERRALLAGLAAAAFPAVPRAQDPSLLEAARKEGSVTWYIAQVDTETAEAMGRAFREKYPWGERVGDQDDRAGRV